MSAERRPERRARVTMKDVARRAGVSQPTVSFVLNDRRDVSVAEETRARVLQAARELHFQPNRAAQSLRSNRPYAIGVIVDRVVSQPYAGQVVLGIQQAVQPHGYVCLVIETSQDPSAGGNAALNLARQGVAGMIYAAPGPEAVDVAAGTEDERAVFVNCWPSSQVAAPIILADEYQGGYDIAAATFAAGHRRVAFLGGPSDDYACLERLRGLEDAARAAAVNPDGIRREFGTFHASSGYDLALKVLKEDEPTALVCGNDRMAMGALFALHSAGLRCPDDVSVLGFDDQPDLADQLHPPLTTVALPHLDMGIAAGRALIDSGSTSADGRELIPCRLVTRDSLRSPNR